MPQLFENIISVDGPNSLEAAAPLGTNPAFGLVMHTDGFVPFAQFILWRDSDQLAVIRARASDETSSTYSAEVPAHTFRPGVIRIQAEGC